MTSWYNYIVANGKISFALRLNNIGSDGEESTCNAEDLGSIPGLERYPEEGNDYSLQYSCLENSMDRGAW